MNPIKQIAEQSIAFVQRAGLQVIECRPGYAVCCMPLSGNENHLGAMYAGALFTLADITGGVLALSSFDNQRYYPLLKDLTMQFLLPAQSDITLLYQFDAGPLTDLQLVAERDGKARFILQGELKNSDGVVVAIAKGEFQVRAIARQ